MISVLAKSLLKSLEVLTDNIHKMPINNFKYQFSVPDGPPEITTFTKLLNQLLTRVHQSLQAHQDFVAQAAHQLKTPLTIAKGHLEELEKSNAPEPDKNLIVALNEIDIMSGTVSNLLTLVQIESGFQTYKASEVDLLDHLMSELDRLEFLARKRSLKFQFLCDNPESSPQDWSTLTDPHLLSIALNNLLENAIKYASESPIEVRLQEVPDGHLIQIANQTVTANSMDVKTSKDIREKFVRGNTPEPGQGLGLYIAYKIVSILNIKLEVIQESSRFTAQLTFPPSSSLR